MNESKERVLARWDILYLTLHSLGFAPDDIQKSITHTMAIDLAPHLDWVSPVHSDMKQTFPLTRPPLFIVMSSCPL
jgi:hypothetical protein